MVFLQKIDLSFQYNVVHILLRFQGPEHNVEKEEKFIHNMFSMLG